MIMMIRNIRSIFSFVDIQCLFAGIIFLLANIMDMIHMITFKIQSKFNYYDMIQLNTQSIIEQWMYRILTINNNYTITILYCLSYIMIIIPIIKIVLVQSNYFRMYHNNSTIHLLIIILISITSVIEIITKLLLLGTQTGMSWMVQGFQLTNWSQQDTYNSNSDTTNNTSNVYRLDSNSILYDTNTNYNTTTSSSSSSTTTTPFLDTIGWKTIEVINNSINSMSLWIDTTQRILLSIIFVLLYISICGRRSTNNGNGNKQQLQFNLVWGKLGLIISLFCIINVIGDFVQFQSWYSKYYINDILFYISLVNRLFCIPLWFTWLSFQLPIIEQQQQQQQSSTSSSYQYNKSNYNNHNNHRTTQTYTLTAHAPDCDDDDYDNYQNDNNEYDDNDDDDDDNIENENPGVYNDNNTNTKNEYDQYGFASKYFVPSTILKSKSNRQKQNNQYLTTVTNIHPNDSGIV